MTLFWRATPTGQRCTLSSHALHTLGVLGEVAPAAAVAAAVAVTRLALILVHLEALVEAHGHGVVQILGCCFQWLLTRRIHPFSSPTIL